MHACQAAEFETEESVRVGGNKIKVGHQIEIYISVRLRTLVKGELQE